jgi:acetylornithine deacetylase
VEGHLRRLGFATERLEYLDAAGVRKASVAGRRGPPGPGGVAFFAHTDVVPADDWAPAEHGPFTPTVADGRLYGRGSCDMKGPLACVLAAAEQTFAAVARAPLYVVCTADEEVGYHGARQVARESRLFEEMAAGAVRGIVAEPTRLEVVHAHKGGCAFTATARGRAAHSSTGLGINANLPMIPFLVAMKALHDEVESDVRWRNAEFSPPTMSWNIGINDHTRAINITAPQSVCTVYFRPMPGLEISPLLDRVRRTATELGIELQFTFEAPPLYVPPDSPFIREMLALTGRPQPKTVGFGTDGAHYGALQNLCVCGPGDVAQAHTNDEWITLADLDAGVALFARAIDRWALQN